MINNNNNNLNTVWPISATDTRFQKTEADAIELTIDVYRFRRKHFMQSKLADLHFSDHASTIVCLSTILRSHSVIVISAYMTHMLLVLARALANARV